MSFESLEQRALLAANVIDVMVVYDDSALTNLNVNAAGNQKLIRQSIESANQVHYNTNDNVVLRLVYTGQVNYADTGVIDTDLSNLQAGNIPLAGSATTVAQQRTNVGADLVSMICSPSFDGGLANLL